MVVLFAMSASEGKSAMLTNTRFRRQLFDGVAARLGGLAVLAVALVLSGCATTRSSVVVQRPGSYTPSRPVENAPPGGTYRVAKGDTLYSIAFRNRVDFRDLARWNGIDSPYTIWPGQSLRLGPAGSGSTSSTASASSAVMATVLATNNKSSQPAHATQTAPAGQPVVVGSTAPAGSSSTGIAPASSVGKPAGAVVAPVPTATAQPAAPVEAVAANTPIASGASRQVSGMAWRWPADGQLLKRFQAGDAIPGIEIAGASGDPVRAAADGVVVYSGNGLVGYGELVIIKHNDSFLSAYGHNRKRLVKEGEKVKAGQTIAEMGSSGASRDELQFQIRKDGNPVDPLVYLPAK
jgi:lipoprotein NlpD